MLRQSRFIKKQIEVTGLSVTLLLCPDMYLSDGVSIYASIKGSYFCAFCKIIIIIFPITTKKKTTENYKKELEYLQ